MKLCTKNSLMIFLAFLFLEGTCHKEWSLLCNGKVLCSRKINLYKFGYPRFVRPGDDLYSGRFDAYIV